MLPERIGPPCAGDLEVEEFDLILLDLLMPDLNGFQVLERLKADERWHDIPVIMISGLQETDSVIRCIEAGAEDYLAKPFNPSCCARASALAWSANAGATASAGMWNGSSWKGRDTRPCCAQYPAGPDRLRLNNGEVVIADRVEEATILFADLVGFTARRRGSRRRSW